ncbi:hypothetical protein Zmor_003629 [Zophobas morio]|uniref:Ig-like domain-containing protein n=1 Tax=Zophobas morio TaxID=2755281 RepID=A0AA38HPQ0_9CUCU|nr:hypothetical protein Zmor_003629 [Zophobas morio]
MVPSSFKLTIVAIVGPKEYCTRRRRVPHHPSPTCSRSWGFTVCSASYINRTRPHPYHVQKVQGFEPADCPRCIIYCKWLLPQCRERPNFLQCILFTHEAGFTRNAVLYSDNTHIWSDMPEKELHLKRLSSEEGFMRVQCLANGVYPRPIIYLQSQKRKIQETQVAARLRGQLYEISVTTTLPTLEDPEEFSCELHIPQANYTVRRETVFYPGKIIFLSLCYISFKFTSVKDSIPCHITVFSNSTKYGI